MIWHLHTLSTTKWRNTGKLICVEVKKYLIIFNRTLKPLIDLAQFFAIKGKENIVSRFTIFVNYCVLSS